MSAESPAPQMSPEEVQKEAARAAELQLHPELAEHPNLVTDRDKAELMAYASKESEEGVTDRKRRAMKAAEDVAASTGSTGGPKPEHHQENIRQGHIDAAKYFREKADQQAKVVGDTYDQIKDL